MKKIKIALLGLGNVGKGVWQIFQNNSEEIFNRCGYEIEIAKILVRDLNKDRGIDVPRDILTTDIEDIFGDDEIKIVVELLGGINPAKDYMMRAIKSRRHVVTANKEALAVYGEELMNAAQEKGVLFYYEASVAGGIPVLRDIKESLTANKIEEIVGIINGTTNYILTKMTHESLDFDTALKEAQQKGYAEADPTSDVEGYDAMYKLAILTHLAFGMSVNIDDIYREGITKIDSADIQNAKEFGYTIKLLAIAKERDSRLELRVHPAMIPSTHPLANVNDVFNAIYIKGNAVGNLMFYGRGAGSLPTGSAVVSDIIAVLRNNMNINTAANVNISEKEILPLEKSESQYYIRMNVADKSGVLGKISTILGENNVSIFSFVQKGKKENYMPLVFITHRAEEGNILKSIKQIEKLPYVEQIKNVIRVENFD